MQGIKDSSEKMKEVKGGGVSLSKDKVTYYEGVPFGTWRAIKGNYY